MLKPIKFTCQDHQGADVARVQQWDGKEWKIISDYYTADLSILDPMVKDAVGQVRRREEDHAARLLQGELSATRRTLDDRGRRRMRRLPFLRCTTGVRCVTDALPAARRRARPKPHQPIPRGEQHRGDLRPRHPGAEGRVAGGAEGRHRRAARRQRRRQDHHAEGDLQPAARRARRGHQGLDRVRRRARSTG